MAEGPVRTNSNDGTILHIRCKQSAQDMERLRHDSTPFLSNILIRCEGCDVMSFDGKMYQNTGCSYHHVEPLREQPTFDPDKTMGVYLSQWSALEDALIFQCVARRGVDAIKYSGFKVVQDRRSSERVEVMPSRKTSTAIKLGDGLAPSLIGCDLGRHRPTVSKRKSKISRSVSEMGVTHTHIRAKMEILASLMDPQEVLDILYQRNFISHARLQQCENLQTGPVLLSKAILRELSNCTTSQFDAVIAALEEHGQKTLADQLKGDVSVEEPIHWNILRIHRKYLIENLTSLNQIADHLDSQGYLDIKDRKDITKKADNKSKTRVLLDKLRMKPYESFESLLEVLRNTSQEFIVDKLTEAKQQALMNNIALQ